MVDVAKVTQTFKFVDYHHLNPAAHGGRRLFRVERFAGIGAISIVAIDGERNNVLSGGDSQSAPAKILTQAGGVIWAITDPYPSIGPLNCRSLIFAAWKH